MSETRKTLRVAVTGASGLVGRRLCAMLEERGDVVYGVGRKKGVGAWWDVGTGEISVPGGRVDVVVHLAGRNVAERWSEQVKKEVWESRVPATERLCGFLAGLPVGERPRVMICASAIGIYGNRGDEVLTEESAVAAEGVSFLADVCRGWEAATRVAAEAGITVVRVRIGVVLAKEGGALAKMAGPVKWGLGGPVGGGGQFMPWISLTDIVRMLMHMMTGEVKGGVVNGVGPEPVRQREFVRTLAKVLRRPAVFPLPGVVVKVVFGQMGEEVLLSSLRVVARKVPEGFTYVHGTLEEAIRGELGM